MRRPPAGGGTAGRCAGGRRGATTACPAGAEVAVGARAPEGDRRVGRGHRAAPPRSVEVDEHRAVVGPGEGKSIILVDHEDSFVHTLGNYLRQTGAEVMTLRSGPSALRTIQQLVDDGKKPDMVVLSPGPGSPTDFELSKTLSLLEENRIPGFGVCLGLQGMVEHFGGELGVLGYPMHGKPSPITLTESGQHSGR